MLDAEIPEGDLSEITAAIQNALKPATTIIQQRLPTRAASALPNGMVDASEAPELEVDDFEQEASIEPRTTKQSREPRIRKPPSMKVLDLDLTSAPSFDGYANNHMPKNDTERNLVALAWFKEHRPDQVVTANHVYTCYRAMKWPSGIDDFPGILRSLKAQQLVKSVGRGEYEINHLGIARVEKLGPAG
ncbi:hypothetical protein ACQR50_04120 [Sphingomonas sp. Xoc002]|uniref:hypothetical protein n=1 Tax=Sphingomonas sp. Xoc002 TaxID=2837624 RepID=UPI003D171930